MNKHQHSDEDCSHAGKAVNMAVATQPFPQHRIGPNYLRIYQPYIEIQMDPNNGSDKKSRTFIRCGFSLRDRRFVNYSTPARQ
jgi:hypothetical protein